MLTLQKVARRRTRTGTGWWARLRGGVRRARPERRRATDLAEAVVGADNRGTHVALHHAQRSLTEFGIDVGDRVRRELPGAPVSEAGLDPLLLQHAVPHAGIDPGQHEARRIGPEIHERRRSDYPMAMLLALGESDGPLHIWFRRPGEAQRAEDEPGHVFVTFFSPRQAIPERRSPNHYRFPIQGGSVFSSICSILALLEEELAGRELTVHFGWPTSSWLDRMATGVFVANLLALPDRYPSLDFAIEHPPRTTGEESDVVAQRDTGT